jgi:iron-sulfur cluster insertion protein
MAPDSTASEGQDFRVSAAAARRISALIQAEGGGDNLRLRVSVSGGGCSGFQYGFSLDDEQHDDDRIFERDGVSVVIDDVSLDVLRGSELDYVQELIGAYFSVKNPNATSTCGCGTSFSV